MENIFKTFNEDFFKSKKNIRWYDKMGILKLDDNVNVVITIDDLTNRDHYIGYKVEIINKVTSTIHSHFFRFKNHLEFTHRGSDKYFHVWLNMGKFDWYVSRPTNTKKMVDTIFDYIHQWN